MTTIAVVFSSLALVANSIAVVFVVKTYRHSRKRDGNQAYNQAVEALVSVKSRFALQHEVFDRQFELNKDLRKYKPAGMDTPTFLLLAGAIWQFAFVYSVTERAEELGLNSCEAGALRREIDLWMGTLPEFRQMFETHTVRTKVHDVKFVEWLRTDVYKKRDLERAAALLHSMPPDLRIAEQSEDPTGGSDASPRRPRPS